MKRVNNNVGKWLCKPCTLLVFVSLLAMFSCKKEGVSPIDRVLGSYYTETFLCPNRATLLDSFSLFTIKRKGNSSDMIEVHFVSHRDASWYGQVDGDTLKFPNQVVATASTEYMQGGVEIKGYGTFKNGIIDFQVDEYYTFNGNRQSCAFSGKKR